MLVQSDDKTVLFAVGSTLVNCTNSYDAEKPDPQLVELAKYAKQHVPEQHPKVTFKSCLLSLYLKNVLQYPVFLGLRMPLLMWRNGLRNCWRQVWCLLWCAW